MVPKIRPVLCTSTRVNMDIKSNALSLLTISSSCGGPVKVPDGKTIIGTRHDSKKNIKSQPHLVEEPVRRDPLSF